MARNVFSSHVDTIDYDSDTQEFRVKWSTGKISVYSGVPPEVAADIDAATSIGGAVYALLRNQYPHAYEE